MVENAHRYGATVLTVVLMAFCSARGWTQQESAVTDSLPRMARELSAAPVIEQRPDAVRWMQSIGAEGIYTGMKSRVFGWAESAAVQSAQHHRQLLIAVPGANIWQSDAAGLQLGIGVRGLSPSRSSHLSVRQNGMPIAADPLGYPEAYYTPPTRAVREVRMVSGAGALQYGSQLGGMLDFVLRDGRDHAGLWGSGALSGIVYSGPWTRKRGRGRGFGQALPKWDGKMRVVNCMPTGLWSTIRWRMAAQYGLRHHHRTVEWRWTPR